MILRYKLINSIFTFTLTYPAALRFTADVFARDLRAPSADRRVTLPGDRNN